jgi:hypothetical protein
MGRLLLSSLVLGGAWFLVNHVGIASLDPRGVGTRVDGREVVRDMGEAEARFSVVGSADAAYMLFGGQVAPRRHSVVHATVAGLPIQHARLIAASYPDFHLCKSPGAPQAQRFTENLSLLAANRGARDALAEALDLYHARIGGDGERTCIQVAGAPLDLESVRLRDGSRDFTDQVARALARERIVLAERVQILDCRELLR